MSALRHILLALLHLCVFFLFNPYFYAISACLMILPVLLGNRLVLRYTVVIMKLGDSVVKSFRVAKVFRENTDRVNSIDFAPNGEALISASDDDSIVIYDCASEGKYVRICFLII